MQITCRLPASQCNAAKTIPIKKEVFVEHGTPESLHTENGPQLHMHCLLSLPQIGNLTTTQVHPGIYEVMVKQKLLHRLSKDVLPMQCAQVRMHS